MTGYVFSVAVAVIVVLFLVQLMRRRRLREKYAGVWLMVAVAVLVLSALPRLAVWLARAAGVQTPSNLIFATSLVVLLGVAIQLSVSLSALEERTRTLTEEIALLKLDLRELQLARQASPEPPDTPRDGPLQPVVDQVVPRGGPADH